MAFRLLNTILDFGAKEPSAKEIGGLSQKTCVLLRDRFTKFETDAMFFKELTTPVEAERAFIRIRRQLERPRVVGLLELRNEPWMPTPCVKT